MKLVVFSPATTSSAIGSVTLAIEEALYEQGHEVVIVRTEDVADIESRTHPFKSKIVRWDDMKRVGSHIQASDAVVYQVGDNFGFHRGCVEWLPQAPGVVCLHDYFVGSLFFMWAQHNRPKAQAVLRSWYGDEVARSFFTHQSGEELIAATHSVAPLTEWVAAMGTAVITHSSWDIQRVLGACPGPVQVIPLAYPHRTLASAITKVSSFHGNKSAAVMTVLTVGLNNENKRSESVIRALGASAMLRGKARYRLVGPITAQRSEKLTALAKGLGVPLTISGEVSDEVLAQAIDEADVLCCLRFPALEAASASTIEALLNGKATIVSDVGFYRELPDEFVRKVSPKREVEELCDILENLYQHPGERQELGARAADWAKQTFSSAHYAEKLVGVCRLAITAAPQLEASRFFADTLLGWGASHEGMYASGASSWLAGAWPQYRRVGSGNEKHT